MANVIIKKDFTGENMFILNQNYKESEISNCVNPDNIYHKCTSIEIKKYKV